MAAHVQSQRDGGVGVVRIQRDEHLNPLDFATLDAVTAALERFDGDGAVRCLLLTGSERAFGSGSDVNDLLNATAIETWHRQAARHWQRLAQLRKPVVAAVSGFAIGPACELVLACDLVVASETARFGLPQVSLGGIPGGGATQRLTRLAGRAIAMDLILTGRTLTAREAQQFGLVSRVVPREHYYSEARAIGLDLAKRPPLALEMARDAIRKADELPLSAGVAYEQHLHALLVASADYREGLRAYLEKRRPVFSGK